MPVSGEGQGVDDSSPSGPPFNPPLYIQRAHRVLELLQEHHCQSFIDAGCSRGNLLRWLLFSQLCERSFSHVVAIDMDENALKEASRTAPPSVALSPVALLHPMRVHFVLGDLTKPPLIPSIETSITKQKTLGSNISFPLTSHFDAIISIEVLEHICPQDVPAFTEVLFAHHATKCGARIVVITTPNRDRNVVSTTGTSSDNLQTDFVSLSKSFCVPGVPYRVRNGDHKFEMTASQFRCYCDYVVEAYQPFVTSYTLFGVGGNFTQGAVFYTKLYSSYCVSHADTRHFNFASEMTKKSLARVRYYLKRQKSFSIPLNSNPDAYNISWVHDISNRSRLFPWGTIFGELSEESDDFKPLICTTPSSYRLVVSVEVPCLSLWERLESAVRESFSSAASMMTSDKRCHQKLRFGDVVKSQNYRMVEPFNASLCALTNSLLEQEVRYKKKAEHKTYLLSTSLVFQVCTARTLYLVLYGFLHKYWGNNKLCLYLQNDTYGSARETLSRDEILLILFLVTAGLLREKRVVNLTYLLRGACRIKGRSGRDFTENKREDPNEQPRKDVAVSLLDHKWLHRLVISLSDCQIPVHPFVGN